MLSEKNLEHSNFTVPSEPFISSNALRHDHMVQAVARNTGTASCAHWQVLLDFLVDVTSNPLASRSFLPGAFLIAVGTPGGLPAILAYLGTFYYERPHCWRIRQKPYDDTSLSRSVQTALLLTSGEIGGLLGTVVFRAQDAPRYIPGLTASLVSQGILLLILFGTTLHFFRKNRLIKAGQMSSSEAKSGFFYLVKFYSIVRHS